MSRFLPLTRPGRPILRRGRGTVQLGIEPDSAVVIDRLSDDAATALLRLDGATGRHEVLTLAPELGDVLDELHRRGVLDDDPGPTSTVSTVRRTRHAPEIAALALAHASRSAALRVLARRARATVIVRGSDPAATHVALGLAASGVGTVALEGPDHGVVAADLTPLGPLEISDSWRQDVSEALRRQGAHPAVVSGRASRPALVVVCGAADIDVPWTDPELADDLLADGITHLALAVSGTAARVGPLVRPGRSACLWCLDGRSTDLDPAWPALADQIRLRHYSARARSTALTSLAAAFAVTQCLAVVDGVDGDPEPASLGAQVEFRLADPLPRVLPVAEHPGCGCGWARSTGTMAG